MLAWEWVCLRNICCRHRCLPQTYERSCPISQKSQSPPSPFPPVFGPNKFSPAPPITSSYFLSGTVLRKQSELRVRGGTDGQQLTRQEAERSRAKSWEAHTQHMHPLSRQMHAHEKQQCKEWTFSFSVSESSDLEEISSVYAIKTTTCDPYLLFSCKQMTQSGNRLTHSEVRGAYWFPTWVTVRIRQINNSTRRARVCKNIRPDSFIRCSLLKLDAPGDAVYLELSHFQRIKP